MIEIWVDGLSEPVIPAWARTACFGYVIKRFGKTIDEGCGVIGKGEDMTNNVGEYTGLIHALNKIKSLKLDKEKIIVRADSKLVAYGMGKDPSTGKSWKIKAPRVLPLCTRAKILAADMDITFEWVPRKENEEADMLCRIAYKSKERKEKEKTENTY